MVRRRFSAHSLRSGFVTKAGLRDKPIAMTGHRTVATFHGYCQSAAIRRSKVDSMLDKPPPKGSVGRYGALVIGAMFKPSASVAERDWESTGLCLSQSASPFAPTFNFTRHVS